MWHGEHGVGEDCAVRRLQLVSPRHCRGRSCTWPRCTGGSMLVMASFDVAELCEITPELN